MRSETVHQQWEVEIKDVQGRVSNLYLWPGTLTCARLMIKVIRGDVVEHEEFTPFFEVSNYEVRCNYRFQMDVPTNCSHMQVFFISGDIHPVSGKPKVVSRLQLSFKDVGRFQPLNKYFTLYRTDRVTQNCIAGGYVRLGLYRSRRSICAAHPPAYNRMSVDQVSVCSSARDQAFPFTHPYEPETDTLPPRPASAVPMLISRDIEANSFVSGSEDVFESNSAYGKTDRSLLDLPEHEEVEKPHEGASSNASANGSDTANIKGVPSIGPGAEESEQSPHRSGWETGQGKMKMIHGRRRSSNPIPWIGFVIGAFGLLGAAATVAIRFLTKRNTRRKHDAKKGMVCC